MNWMRVGLVSGLLACGSCLLLLTGQTVFAKERTAKAPLRKDLFVIRPNQPIPYREAQNKVSSDDIPLPDGAGKDTAKKLCGSCHSTDVWAKQRHSTNQWSSIIDNMVSKGLIASDDDLAKVNDYLSKYLAPPSSDMPPPAPQH